MPVTEFFTISARIRGEYSDGDGRIDYFADAASNVVLGTDSGVAEVFSLKYGPFGLITDESGNLPKFSWGGASGYYTSQALLRFSTFVRSRFIDKTDAVWLTVDKYWPILPAYSYGFNNPYLYTDPDGREPTPTVKRVPWGPAIFTRCGGYDVLWMYSLTGKVNGWLIQEVIVTQRFGLCTKVFKVPPFVNDGKVDPCSSDGGNTLHYFEAYKVLAGEVYTPVDQDGHYGNQNPDKFHSGSYPCTAGDINQTGKLMFTTDSSLIKGWKPGRKSGHPCAGDLLMSLHFPQFKTLPGTEGVVKSQWSCCYDICDDPCCPDRRYPGQCREAITSSMPS